MKLATTLTTFGAAVLLTVAPTVAAQAQAPAHHSKTAIAVNHKVIRSGQSATFHGSVSPNLRGHRVYLQQRIGTHWKSVTHRSLGTRSRYSFTVRPRSTGTRKYRVYDPATRSVAKSFSRAVTLTIRPRAVQHCTPGYSPCIPPGPDVDCAGGSGNGPRFVHGPIRVTGSDPYDLDSDGDGIGCES